MGRTQNSCDNSGQSKMQNPNYHMTPAQQQKTENYGIDE
jgi:hypothetical protein